MPISKQTLLARLSGFPIISTQTAMTKSALANFPQFHQRNSDQHATFNGHSTLPHSAYNEPGHCNLDVARIPIRRPSNPTDDHL